jgi:hypothetical protein
VAKPAGLVAEHAGVPQLVHSEQFGKVLPPKGASAVRGAVLRTHGFLIEALRAAAASGDVRRDIPPEELALIVMGSFVARALLAALGDKWKDGLRMNTEVAWNDMLTLLRPPTRAPAPPLKKGVVP